MNTEAAEPTPDVLAELSTWVVKDGVGLGGLSFEQRNLALAVAWAGLPTVVMSEKDVNLVLQTQRVGAASFLATDHVELRRWLVDVGWLQRDGWGREYRRVPLQHLPTGARAVAEALSGLDVAAWVAQTRLHHAARRDQRRQAWRAAQSTVARSAA